MPVMLYVKGGAVTPRHFWLKALGEWVKILEVTERRRRASLAVGAVGIRYTCVVWYNESKREIYLFDEGDNNWFIESGE